MPNLQSPITNPRQIEPVDFGHNVPVTVSDLADELLFQSGRLSEKLSPLTASNLASSIRVMNTYYSNLIEGHQTLPRDIERGLRNDFDQEITKRNLQLEALSHLKLQEYIDNLAATNNLPEPASKTFILDLHRKFYASAPKLALKMGEGKRSFQMEPGRWRSKKIHDVTVGRHLPPPSHLIDKFMTYYEERFKFDHLDRREKIIAFAISHHRFNFIHPFPDGNGRVSRLMSHAMAAKAGIGAYGLWSVSRGLARGLDSRSDYKLMLSHADTPYEDSSKCEYFLTRKALQTYAVWFLAVCLDQIEFMIELFDFDNLSKKFKQLIQETDGLKFESVYLLEEAFLKGEFERGAATRLTGLPERTSRRLLKNLIDVGLLASQTPKGPVSLRFPVYALEKLFPKLFPVL